MYSYKVTAPNFREFNHWIKIIIVLCNCDEQNLTILQFSWKQFPRFCSGRLIFYLINYLYWLFDFGSTCTNHRIRSIRNVQRAIAETSYIKIHAPFLGCWNLRWKSVQHLHSWHYLQWTDRGNVMPEHCPTITEHLRSPQGV